MPKDTFVVKEVKEVKQKNQMPQSEDPFVGKTLGNCKILSKFAEGGSAYIYKAHNTHFNLDRIVKILKPSLVNEVEFFTNFKQEAQLTARLEHSHILRIFDTGKYEGHFFIEMEYIQGNTLREYQFYKPKIPESELLSFALQIIKALRYAHEIEIQIPDGDVIHGILHRDIKPENIMVNTDKKIYLMDFGAAKPLNITSETKQTLLVGTIHYMSPEQVSGDFLDVRSDFFSLGIVLYELCTGKKPFEAHNLAELIEKIKLGKYPRLHKLRPSISPLTEELIDNLLARKPQHRPSSAKEIQSELKRCFQAYNSWGTGKKIRVPFSFKKFFPTCAFTFSLVALLLSVLAFWRTLPTTPRHKFPGENDGASLLEKGKKFEANKMWRKAINVFESVPSRDKGGRANEYLEAQIRMAHLSFKYFNQFTKARSLLESLRLNFSDPSIDAYLGQIYFKLALYNEAVNRFTSVAESKKGSVIPQTKKFKREALFYHASAIDKQYTYVDKNPIQLVEAIKTWKHYLEFSGCKKLSGDKDCAIAKKRAAALKKKNGG